MILEAVDPFTNGRFEKTLATRREDEIGKLAVGFNVMAEKLQKAYACLEGREETSMGT